MSANASYLYVVARDVADGCLDGITGIGAEPVRLVRSGRLTGVVSTVDLAEFGEAPLRDNLESLPWLERTARLHDEVVRGVDADAVVPMRLATVYRDDERIVAELHQQEAFLSSVLDAVAGYAEWSVKVFAPATAERHQPPRQDGTGESGAMYLRRRRDEQHARENRRSELEAVGLAAHEQIAAAAARAQRLPLHDARLSGRAGDMVLNGAYLVSRTDEERFARVIEQFDVAHPDYAADLRGPWPPYSFSSLDAQPLSDPVRESP